MPRRTDLPPGKPPADQGAGPPWDQLPDPGTPSGRHQAASSIVSHLSEALGAARQLDLDLLAYLIDLARIEAEREAMEPGAGEPYPRVVM